jgi:integrase/recombinase XerC
MGSGASSSEQDSVALVVPPPAAPLAPRPFDHPGERRVFESFLEGRSEATRRAYKADLESFATFTGDTDPEVAIARLLSSDPGAANGKVLEYRNRLRADGLSSATINRRLATLRSMTKLARMLGRISWHLEVEGFDAMAYRDTAGPGMEILTVLFAAVGARKDAKGIRDFAILRLLFDLGLRRGEVVELNVTHLSERGVSVLGKGRRAREMLTLPEETRASLEAWLAVHPGGDPLFVNLDPGTHTRLTGHGLYVILATWAKTIEKTVKPHGVRHTAITTVLEITNGNTRAGQIFARHKNANTTTRYDDNRRDSRGESAMKLSALIPSQIRATADTAGEINDPEGLLALIPEEPKPKRPRSRRSTS